MHDLLFIDKQGPMPQSNDLYLLNTWDIFSICLKNRLLYSSTLFPIHLKSHTTSFKTTGVMDGAAEIINGLPTSVLPFPEASHTFVARDQEGVLTNNAIVCGQNISLEDPFDPNRFVSLITSLCYYLLEYEFILRPFRRGFPPPYNPLSAQNDRYKCTNLAYDLPLSRHKRDKEFNRAIVGNGFFRPLNRYDHMKRVLSQKKVAAGQISKSTVGTHKRKIIRLKDTENKYYECRSKLIEELAITKPQDSNMLQKIDSNLQELITWGLQCRQLKASFG
jgi:hypothetical protein